MIFNTKLNTLLLLVFSISKIIFAMKLIRLSLRIVRDTYLDYRVKVINHMSPDAFSQKIRIFPNLYFTQIIILLQKHIHLVIKELKKFPVNFVLKIKNWKFS